MLKRLCLKIKNSILLFITLFLCTECKIQPSPENVILKLQNNLQNANESLQQYGPSALLALAAIGGSILIYKTYMKYKTTPAEKHKTEINPDLENDQDLPMKMNKKQVSDRFIKAKRNYEASLPKREYLESKFSPNKMLDPKNEMIYQEQDKQWSINKLKNQLGLMQTIAPSRKDKNPNSQEGWTAVNHKKGSKQNNRRNTSEVGAQNQNPEVPSAPELNKKGLMPSASAKQQVIEHKKPGDKAFHITTKWGPGKEKEQIINKETSKREQIKKAEEKEFSELNSKILQEIKKIIPLNDHQVEIDDMIKNDITKIDNLRRVQLSSLTTAIELEKIVEKTIEQWKDKISEELLQQTKKTLLADLFTHYFKNYISKEFLPSKESMKQTLSEFAKRINNPSNSYDYFLPSITSDEEPILIENLKNLADKISKEIRIGTVQRFARAKLSKQIAENKINLQKMANLEDSQRQEIISEQSKNVEEFSKKALLLEKQHEAEKLRKSLEKQNEFIKKAQNQEDRLLRQAKLKERYDNVFYKIKDIIKEIIDGKEYSSNLTADQLANFIIDQEPNTRTANEEAIKKLESYEKDAIRKKINIHLIHKVLNQINKNAS